MNRSIHTYRAATIEEAMDLVRNELGVDSKSDKVNRTVRTLAECRSEHATMISGHPAQVCSIPEESNFVSTQNQIPSTTTFVQQAVPNLDRYEFGCTESVAFADSAAADPVALSTKSFCHTIAVSGGKGGVGRSVIAVNLAIALAQRGGRVGLVDASPDYGSVEILCGLNGYWNLAHVAQRCRNLDEVALRGPAGIKVLSGASCLTGDKSSNESIFEQLAQFEAELDWIVVDASGGSSQQARPFVEAADDLLLVATPEATAITDAYASLKSYSRNKGPRLGLLVNQANSTEVGSQILDRLQQAAHSFLQVDLHRRGAVPRDLSVPASVNLRRPFVMHSPASPAADAVRRLAERWTKTGRQDQESNYFLRLKRTKNTEERTPTGRT